MDDYFSQLARIESGDNPLAKANTSSATGRYQLTQGTFKDVQTQGSPWLRHASWEQHASNPDIQREAAEVLTNRNVQALKKSGFEDSPLNRYVYHFAGAGGGQKLLSAAPDALVGDVLGAKAAEANPRLAKMTVSQFMNNFQKKLGSSQTASVAPWERYKKASMAEGGAVAPWEKFSSIEPASETAAEVDPAVSDAKAQKTSKVKLPKQDVGKLEGTARAFLSGATMGWGDELIGRGRAWTAPLREKLYGKPQIRDVNQSIALERAKQEQFAKDNPWISTGAEVAGGLATAVPALFSGVGTPAAIANAGRLAKTAYGATKIAGMGGVAGAGTADTDLSEGASAGDNLDKRLSGAQSGAVTSLLLAPVLGVGAHAGIKGYHGIKNRFFSGAPQAEKAERHVVNRLVNDQVTPEKIRGQAALAAKLDSDQRLLDVGGKHVDDLTQTLVSKSGVGSRELADTLEDRIHGARENIANKINTQISGGKAYHATKDALDLERATKAKPLYDAAYAAEPVKSDIVNGLLQMEPFQKAFKRAQVLAKQEAVQFQVDSLQKIAKVTDPKEKARLFAEMDETYKKMLLPDITPETFKVGIPVKSLDMVKRGIDDIQKGAYRPNATQVDIDDARALKGLKNSFLQEIDERVPQYAQARKTAKGSIESTEAVEAGRDTFLKVKSANDLKKDFQKLDDHDKEYFRIGAKEALLHSIMNTARDINAGKTIINNPNTRDKLAVLFDSPADFMKFKKGLEAEAAMVIRAQKSMRGSQTQPRLASEKEWDESAGLAQDLLSTLGSAAQATINPGVSSSLGFVSKAGNLIKRPFVPKFTEQQATEAAQMLNQPLTVVNQQGQRVINPQVENLLTRLQKRQQIMAKQQEQLAIPFSPLVAPRLGGSAVVAREEPQGYVERPLGRAGGGYTGPLSNMGTLSAMGMGPLSMLQRALGGSVD